jgi:hypothetical protein
MAVAVCVLAAVAACSKQEAAETTQAAGAKIDRAAEKTQQKIGAAGERAKDDVTEAARKAPEALSQAGDRLSNAPQSQLPPYALRQPVQDSVTITPAAPGAAAPAAPAAAAGSTVPNAANVVIAPPAGTPMSTTATSSTGPITSLTITPQ